MTNPNQKLTDQFIKLQPKIGPYQIVPSDTEAHFIRKNARSSEDERFRISKPTLEEIKKFYPELVTEEAIALEKAGKKVDFTKEFSDDEPQKQNPDKPIPDKLHPAFVGKGKAKGGKK